MMIGRVSGKWWNWWGPVGDVLVCRHIQPGKERLAPDCTLEQVFVLLAFGDFTASPKHRSRSTLDPRSDLSLYGDLPWKFAQTCQLSIDNASLENIVGNGKLSTLW